MTIRQTRVDSPCPGQTEVIVHSRRQPTKATKRLNTRCVTKAASTTPRTLHLLDLENLVSGRVTAQRCSRVWREYVDTVGLSGVDQIVVAVARRNGLVTGLSLPPRVRLIFGEDCPDGADRALVAAVDVRHDAARFQRVVIASGDHHFVPLAREFRRLGTEVAQAMGAARVSSDLYLACSTNFVLPIHNDDTLTG